MKTTAILATTGLLAALLIGCSSTTRHRVLTFLFDGVPPPRSPAQAPAGPEAAAAATAPRTTGYREHGPYAAKMCDACHEGSAANALVLPSEELCLRCHALRQDERYVHGPLSSGGCLVCHDPHGSRYRYLLVSESDTFCFHCHDRARVERSAAHQGVGEQCTRCHDAHMSNQKYLLK